MITIVLDFPVEQPFEEYILHAVQTTIEHEHASGDTDVTITLTGDEQLRALNQTYLGIDAPTDVLSFNAAETDPQTGRMQLGDVVVSIPRAQAQAAAAGHPLQAEIELLVVHGVLHLLGHDHADQAEKSTMWAAQAEILAAIGSQLSRLPD